VDTKDKAAGALIKLRRG